MPAALAVFSVSLLLGASVVVLTLCARRIGSVLAPRLPVALAACRHALAGAPVRSVLLGRAAAETLAAARARAATAAGTGRRGLVVVADRARLAALATGDATTALLARTAAAAQSGLRAARRTLRRDAEAAQVRTRRARHALAARGRSAVQELGPLARRVAVASRMRLVEVLLALGVAAFTGTVVVRRWWRTAPRLANATGALLLVILVIPESCRA